MIHRFCDPLDEISDMDLARFVTAIEGDEPEALSVLSRSLVRSTKRSPRIGITGAGGAGKSTLIASLAAHWPSESRAGVIAVDPSSEATGGAMLGDRFRLYDRGPSSSADTNIFLRSMGSRGAGNALARCVSITATLLEQASLSPVVIETVGAGQGDIAIKRMVDVLVLVLTPESGDSIQMLKAGQLELADIIVVNKADRPGADRLAAQLRGLARTRAQPVDGPRSAGQPIVHVVQANKEATDGMAELVADLLRVARAQELARDSLWRDSVSSLLEERLARQAVARARLSKAWLDAVSACARGDLGLDEAVCDYLSLGPHGA